MVAARHPLANLTPLQRRRNAEQLQALQAAAARAHQQRVAQCLAAWAERKKV